MSLAGLTGFAGSIIAPGKPRTNTSTFLIKVFAFFAMLCDHFGKMIFPQYGWLRLIGRMAFPLFAYSLAFGAAMTRHPLAYLTRVAALALLSQPLYALGLAHENAAMYSVPFFSNPVASAWQFYLSSWQKPSILFSLVLGLAILAALRERRFFLAFFVYILCERFSGSLDYGIYGIRFILLCYALLEHPALYFAFTLLFWLHWSSQGSGYSFFGHSFSMRIFGLPGVLFTAIPIRGKLRMPRWLSYGFYPAHLAVLAAITHFPTG